MQITKRCEVHERKQTYPETATVETWTLFSHNAASRNCRDASGMESESWNPKINGSASARLKTEEPTWTLLVCCCNKVRPKVWTKLKGEKITWKGPIDDARRMEQKHKCDVCRKREYEEEGEEAEVEEQISFLPVRHASRWRTNGEESIPTTLLRSKIWRNKRHGRARKSWNNKGTNR